MVAIDSTPRVQRTDSIFFPLMAIAMALVVFVGFAPTFYLREQFNGPPLSLLEIIHGTAFTAWIGLLIVQTGLVAANRRDVHRKLGVAGACLAVVMVVLGTWLAIDALRRGLSPPGLPSAAAFFAVPIAAMVGFSALIGSGVLNRRRLAYHKRYILLGTALILGAAVARLPLAVVQSGPFVGFLITDTFLIAMMAYDLATSRRVHPATLWSGVVLVASQFLPMLIGGTQLWHDFASLLT